MGSEGCGPSTTPQPHTPSPGREWWPPAHRVDNPGREMVSSPFSGRGGAKNVMMGLQPSLVLNKCTYVGQDW